MEKYRTYEDAYNISNEMVLEIQPSSCGAFLTYPVTHLTALHLVLHDVFQLNCKHFQFSILTTNTVFFTKNVCPYLTASVAQII